MRHILLFSFLLLLSLRGFSQSSNELGEIDNVWQKFSKAFSMLDYKIMAEIHSKNLVRISGDKIIDYDTYINRYKERFRKAKEDGIAYEISLRFFERINDDSKASERGVYQLIRNKNTSTEQTYYGQFHVIFTKENQEWKILMDYDSNEMFTIDKRSYLSAIWH